MTKRRRRTITILNRLQLRVGSYNVEICYDNRSRIRIGCVGRYFVRFMLPFKAGNTIVKLNRDRKILEIK